MLGTPSILYVGFLNVFFFFLPPAFGGVAVRDRWQADRHSIQESGESLSPRWKGAKRSKDTHKGGRVAIPVAWQRAIFWGQGQHTEKKTAER